MKRKGFTLIELLVVIAIIGLLASITIVNVNSARRNAKTAAVLASYRTLHPGAALCLASGGRLIQDGTTLCDAVTPMTDGTSICTGTGTSNIAVWPDLPDGWQHTFCVDNPADDSSIYLAVRSDGCSISCTNESCAVDPIC